MLTPKLFIMDTIGMSCAEVGRMFIGILDAAQSGDVATLNKHRFIGRYYKGYTPSARLPIPQAVRNEVLAIGICAICSSKERLEVDHITPVSRGGGNERGNLQPLCFICNRRKGARV